MTAQDTANRMKVFVSYARADLDFVDQLVLALEDKGFEALLDRHNIDAAERWQERLTALITSSDTVVFVLSPTSAQSKICQWEVTEAAKQGKRLVPVVPVPLQKIDAPAELAALNYIHFYKDESMPGSGFYDGVRKLERALRVDLGWLRLQTRLTEDAGEWAVGQSEDRLLRGAALEEALTWQQRTPQGQVIPDRLRDFLRQSETAENLRKAEVSSRIAEREESLRKISRRTTMGLVGASGLTVLSGGLAWWGLDAESRFRAERDRVAKAEEEARRKLIETEAARTDIEGQITVYAAAPGQGAQDGKEGENSPFTTAVLNALSEQDIPIQQALARASLNVSRKTGGEQRPYIATNMNGDIFLHKPRRGQLRRALCISVDEIKGTSVSLLNTGKDAEAWQSVLVAAGFEVRILKNPTLAEVNDAIVWSWTLPSEKQGRLRPKANPLLVPASISVTPKAGSASPEEQPAPAAEKSAPEEVPQPEIAPASPEATPPGDLLVLIFYAGVGVTSGGQEYLAMADSELKENDNKSTLTNVLSISEVNTSLQLQARLSVLLLDTNFSPIDSVEVSPRR
jgi:TIR domain